MVTKYQSSDTAGLSKYRETGHPESAACVSARFAYLKSQGYKVVVIWECELAKDPEWVSRALPTARRRGRISSRSVVIDDQIASIPSATNGSRSAELFVSRDGSQLRNAPRIRRFRYGLHITS